MNRFGEILRKGWQGAKNRVGIAIAAVIVLLVAFVLGFHLFFPVAAAQRWLIGEIESRLPVRARFTSLALRPLFVLNGRELVLTFVEGGLPPVTVDEISFKPLWPALLTDNPGMAIEGGLFDGRFEAAVQRNGNLALQTSGVTLREFPINPATLTLLSGTLTKGELRRSFPANKPVDNRLTVEIDNCALQMMGQRLPLGRVTAEGSGQGNSLRLTTLTAAGGELAVSGTGALLLGTTPAASRISLDLSLRPAASASPSLASLLDLAARRQGDGSYRLRLSGSPNQLAVETPAVPGPSPGAATSIDSTEEEE